jgi:excisionase family DNA binding protein
MAGTRKTPQRPAIAGTLPPPPRNWTTVKDAADRAGVSLPTLYRWAASGRVVARQLGRVWRVRLASDGFPMMASDVEVAA